MYHSIVSLINDMRIAVAEIGVRIVCFFYKLSRKFNSFSILFLISLFSLNILFTHD